MNNVLVVGSGGREHALAWKLAESSKVEKVFVAPGNGGTQRGKLESVAIPVTDHDGLIAFAKEHDVALVVIGPDDALAAGIADDLAAVGLTVFGCSKAAAQIESSKAFAKDLMKEHGVPTAAYETFIDIEAAREYAASQPPPIVVKASGLALGKGVYICESHEEVETALSDIMLDKKFGESGNEVVIEQFLTGTELSTHVLTDGTTAYVFPPSQDHKAAYDGNKGPNTGGMGVVAPLPWADAVLMKKAETEIVKPILAALEKSGSPFSGLLYPGLMESGGELNVVEFNARFGDPETQCYIRLLESDLFDALHAAATGSLSSVELVWKSQYAACVVLASEGYPGSYAKGKVITGIEDAESDPDVVVFHAGTKKEGERTVTSGGRVLNVTAVADTLEEALKKAYAAVKKIEFDGKYFRTDIGQATLKRSSR